MRRRSLALFFLGALSVASAAAQGPVALPPAVRAAAESITSEQLMRDLSYLASDELAGRDTGSPGFDKAAAYIVERLKKAGLKPLGDDGTYLQHYELRETTVQTGDAVIEINGARFSFGDGFVMRSIAAPLSGTFQAVYVGHGWTAPSQKIDPFAGLDVKGKLVIAHGPRAMPRGMEILQLGRISIGATPVVQEAHRRGAAGVVFIPLSSALTGWEAARSQNLTVREVSPWVPSAYAATPITSVLLSGPATEALLRGERMTATEAFERGDTRDYPASFQLTKSVRVHIPARVTTSRPYNVVAGIDGADPTLRDQYITIEAHLDGAVGSRTVDGDAIYNSADDNATGSAGALNIAERMAALRPKRSLIFIWDSGEERGLWGTRYFVHAPPVPLDRIVVHFNVDMIGATRAPGTGDANSPDVTGPNEVLVIGPGVLSQRADGLLNQVNREYLNMTFDRRFDMPQSEFFYPRTDAGPFLERGILPIGFFTGLHARYHLPADEVKYLDPVKLHAVTRTVFAAIWAFAEVPDRPRIDRPLPETVLKIVK